MKRQKRKNLPDTAKADHCSICGTKLVNFYCERCNLSEGQIERRKREQRRPEMKMTIGDYLKKREKN